MTKKEESHFDKLNKIDVSKKLELKKDLIYLSWAWAWGELLKIYPKATYKVLKFENNLPYVYDPTTGYMVFTKVTVEDVTHEMWLPVMDSKNKAMKDKPYTYKTKYGNKEVEAASMFDINKTIMRCIVKNIAMFGLALYIYAGEDLPDVPNEQEIKYKKLKDSLQDSISPLKDVTAMNDYLKVLGKHEPIGDSKIIEKNLLNDKMKELNLNFDKMENKFIEKPKLTDDEKREIEGKDD